MALMKQARIIKIKIHQSGQPIVNHWKLWCINFNQLETYLPPQKNTLDYEKTAGPGSCLGGCLGALCGGLATLSQVGNGMN